MGNSKCREWNGGGKLVSGVKCLQIEENSFPL